MNFDAFMSRRALQPLALCALVWIASVAAGVAAETPLPKLNGIIAIAGRTNALVELKLAGIQRSYKFWLESGERVDTLELTSINPKAGVVTVVVDGVAATLDLGAPPNGGVPTLNLKNADSRSVLDLYQRLAGRTVLRSPTLPVTKVTLQSAAGLRHSAVVDLLGQALRENGVFVQPRGDKFTFATEFSKVPRLAGIKEPPAPPSADDKKTELVPPGLLKFSDADHWQVLDIYQELTGRTLLQAPGLPPSKVTLLSQTELSRNEAMWMLEAALYLGGISVVNEGRQFAFILPGNRNAAAPKIADNPAEARLKQKPAIPAGTLRISQERRGIPPPTISLPPGVKPEPPTRDPLTIYAELIGREPLREANTPSFSVQFRNQTSLHAVEAAYALDALAALHNLRFVPVGDNQVKLVHVKDAGPSAGQP